LHVQYPLTFKVLISYFNKIVYISICVCTFYFVCIFRQVIRYNLNYLDGHLFHRSHKTGSMDGKIVLLYLRMIIWRHMGEWRWSCTYTLEEDGPSFSQACISAYLFDVISCFWELHCLISAAVRNFNLVSNHVLIPLPCWLRDSIQEELQ
jgi:hypothetical protein